MSPSNHKSKVQPMTTIKTSYILIAAVVVPLLFSQPQVAQQQANLAPVRDFRQEEREARVIDRAKAQEARRDSPIALERVKGFCTLVYDKATQQSRGLQEGEPSYAANGAVLPEGGHICTTAGSTAVVRGGVARDVRNIAVEDREEYLKYLEMQGE
jgi:hypothetical protein